MGWNVPRHVSILRTGLFGQETESPKRNAMATGQPRGVEWGAGTQNPLPSSSGLSPHPRAGPPHLCWGERPWATVDHVTEGVGAAVGVGTGWGAPVYLPYNSPVPDGQLDSWGPHCLGPTRADEQSAGGSPCRPGG